MSFSSLCIYCGSSNDVAPKFKEAAQKTGEALAARKIRMVYGGGKVGLMGIAADAVMQKGGAVTGIIPEHIRAHEVQHNGLTELIVVPDMHTRKRMMVERADGFIVLPGGLGTLDEAFEILTWKKLKLHDKPVFVFNQDGFWDPMLALIDRTVEEKFSAPRDRDLYKVAHTLDELLTLIDAQGEVSTVTRAERM